MGQKILIISEELNFPFDEGIKNFAYNLIRGLSKDNKVFTISIRGDTTNERYIEKLNVNKTFLSYSLLKKINTFNPAIIIYIPSPSATIYSFMRIKVLKLYAKRIKIVMFALQPRKYSFISQKLIPFLAPNIVLVQSRGVLKQLCKFGCDVKLIPSGVDLKRFHPVNNERKLELRKKYGMAPSKFLVLHVGHVNTNRNIQVLKELQGNNSQVILVGSTSTKQNKGLVEELRVIGVKVVTDYLENIEEIYQLSDLYLFPVQDEGTAISFPLTILEAMAVDLPVIASDIGPFKEILGKNDTCN